MLVLSIFLALFFVIIVIVMIFKGLVVGLQGEEQVASIPAWTFFMSLTSCLTPFTEYRGFGKKALKVKTHTSIMKVLDWLLAASLLHSYIKYPKLQEVLKARRSACSC